MYPGVVLLTGSNGGIGSAVAEYLLSQGVRNIACQYRTESENLSRILSNYDLDPAKHAFEASLDNEDQVTTLRTRIEEKLGEVWGLLNIAGSSTNAMSWKLTREDFERVLADNLTSTFLCCREFIPGMRKSGTGRIVNFSSVVGQTGTVGAAHYCAAKAGIVGWTKALAIELAPKAISVNAMSLGYFQYGLINELTPEMQTEIQQKIPLKRFGDGSEIGGYLRFLLSEEGAYTTGQVLQVNGGLY